MIIYLTGYMGSGKSTLGREIARRTGFRFVDMDGEIEKKCGMAVSEIFERQSEDFFRECEAEELAEISRTTGNLIVATGGGVPCFGDNMDVMNATGHTIYLKFSPEKLAIRLGPGQQKRPILRGMSRDRMAAFIGESLAARAPYYLKASVVIDGDSMSDEHICSYIEELIRRSEQPLI